jgi:hypothetical protein
MTTRESTANRSSLLPLAALNHVHSKEPRDDTLSLNQGSIWLSPPGKSESLRFDD